MKGLEIYIAPSKKFFSTPIFILKGLFIVLIFPFFSIFDVILTKRIWFNKMFNKILKNVIYLCYCDTEDKVEVKLGMHYSYSRTITFGCYFCLIVVGWYKNKNNPKNTKVSLVEVLFTVLIGCEKLIYCFVSWCFCWNLITTSFIRFFYIYQSKYLDMTREQKSGSHSDRSTFP